jgi:hypothetical protein
MDPSNQQRVFLIIITSIFIKFCLLNTDTMASTTTCAQFETGHMDTVHDAQFDYYGKHVATCSSDRLVKIFTVTGNQVWCL